VAHYRAITAVCEGVLSVLRSSYRPDDFNNELDFQVYLARDFATPMAAGVSLFLYRIFPNGTHRTPAGRIGPDGRRYRSQLPLDLHFILTAWGKDASLQHSIAGWMMRTLEDTPILTSGLLNTVVPGALNPDETVELSLAELTTEDMLRMWEALVQNVYQLSIPYVARAVRIESEIAAKSSGLPVQERQFEYRKMERE
jgi:hypothetical protein